MAHFHSLLNLARLHIKPSHASVCFQQKSAWWSGSAQSAFTRGFMKFDTFLHISTLSCRADTILYWPSIVRRETTSSRLVCWCSTLVTSTPGNPVVYSITPLILFISTSTYSRAAKASLQRMRGSFKCLKTSSDHTWRRRRKRYVRFSEQYPLFLIVKRGLELLLLIYEIDFLFIRAYPITFETFPLGTLLKLESRILTPRFWYRSNIWPALRNFSMR